MVAVGVGETVVCEVREVAKEAVLVEYGVVRAEAEESVEQISCETTKHNQSIGIDGTNV